MVRLILPIAACLVALLAPYTLPSLLGYVRQIATLIPRSATTTVGLKNPATELISTNTFATDTTTTTTTTSVTMSQSLRRAAPLVVPAVGKHTATVIFAHGLGDSGHGWADAVEHWRSGRRLDEVKFILPHAPTRPITVNRGMSMPGWFDVKVLGQSTQSIEERARTSDKEGILDSMAYLHKLIQEEVSSGVTADRIILGGFSQGGGMALLSGVTASVKLAGIIGLSSWMLLVDSFKEHVPAGNPNKDTPIFMGHGTHDPMVLYDWGKASEKLLKESGHNVTMTTYPGMGHSTCLDELNDVEEFIVKRLSNKA